MSSLRRNDNTSAIYPRAWTPADHFWILHAGRVNGYTFDVSVKIRSEEDCAFWQSIEDLRYGRAIAEYEERRKKGPPGGKPKRKIFADIPRGKVTPIIFDGGGDLLDMALDGLAGRDDVYLNQNTLVDWRKTALMRSVSKVYIDLDDPEWLYGLSLEEVAKEVLDFCQLVGIPVPSYIIKSGVGLNVVWLHTVVHKTHFPREGEKTTDDWKDTIKALFDLFQKRFLPDPAARDMTRIFRICGSVNSKSGATVHPIFVAGDDDLEPQVYDFERLSDQITMANLFTPPLPHLCIRSQAEIEAKAAAASARRKATEPAKKPKTNKNAEKKNTQKPASKPAATVPETTILPEPSFARAEPLDDIAADQIAEVAKVNDRYAYLLADIYDIIKLRGGVTEGMRDEFLFCVAVCLARGGYRGNSLANEIHRLVPHAAGIDRDEALAFMGAVLARADTSHEGHDVRYHLTNESVRRRLSITDQELVKIDSRTLHKPTWKELTEEEKAADARERKRRQRGQQGAGRSREDLNAAQDDRAATILRHAENGISVRRIAEITGFSKSVVGRTLAAHAARQETPESSPSETVPDVTLIKGSRERGDGVAGDTGFGDHDNSESESRNQGRPDVRHIQTFGTLSREGVDRLLQSIRNRRAA